MDCDGSTENMASNFSLSWNTTAEITHILSWQLPMNFQLHVIRFFSFMNWWMNCNCQFKNQDFSFTQITSCSFRINWQNIYNILLTWWHLWLTQTSDCTEKFISFLMNNVLLLKAFNLIEKAIVLKSKFFSNWRPSI